MTETQANNDENKHLCPRRAEHGTMFKLPDTDLWQVRRPGLPRTCSFCGSVHPEDFLKLAAEGAKLTPTDKAYKVYIDVPEPSPNEQEIYSSSDSEDSPGIGYTHKDKLTPEQKAIYDRRFPDTEGHVWQPAWVKFEKRHAVEHMKHYFQHLAMSDEHRQKFVELLNEKKLSIGVPGHFYVLPYFVVPAK